MITSNNYCKISGGGGNSLSGNYAVCARGSEFPSTHNGLGALCAWEAACLLLFFFLSIPILFNYLNVPAFKGVMRMESCFLRNANCACWELFSINLTGVAGALCASDCRVNVFCFITSIFYSNSLKKQKCQQGSPLVKPIFLYCKSFYFEINHHKIKNQL